MPTTSLSIKVIHIAIYALFSLFISPLQAAQNDNTYTSKSISFSSLSPLNKAAKDNRFKQTLRYSKAVNIEQTSKLNNPVSESYTEYTSTTSTADIYAYNASTYLIEDTNNDGFYHRFSIDVDIDTNNASADVYMKTYLSHENGPWIYYASSDVYTIYGDNANDSINIETELYDGFEPGYYDIKIEIYDANSGYRVDNISAYQLSSLSALTLESYDYDNAYSGQNYTDEYYETTYVHGQGAINFYFLGAFILVLLWKYKGKAKLN